MLLLARLFHLGTAARVQAAAVRVCDAADAHAVERLAARITSSAPASTPAVLEDAKEVADVGYNTAAVVAVGSGEVLLACLGQVAEKREMTPLYAKPCSLR